MLVVDERARTIAGLAVPYGRVARNDGRRWRFLPGWSRPAEDRLVPALEDHNHSLRIGRVEQLADIPAGLHAVLQIRRGRRGDRALAQAAAGRVGMSVRMARPVTYPDPADLGVLVVVSAFLEEISLTPDPAFKEVPDAG